MLSFKALVESRRSFSSIVSNSSVSCGLDEWFHRLERGWIHEADSISLSTSFLDACKNLSEVKRVDELIRSNTSSSFRNKLLQAYIKHGGNEDARNMFLANSEWDMASWTCMLSANSQNGHSEEAFLLFSRMQLEGLRVEKPALLSLLQGCKYPNQKKLGVWIESQVHESGFGSDLYLGNALITMHARCGSLEDAWRCFDQMIHRDSGSWNSLISACVLCKKPAQALQVLHTMQLEGVKPNNRTLMTMLSSCEENDLKKVKFLHLIIVLSNREPDVILSTALLNAYSECGCLRSAREVFRGMKEPDLVSLNAMIASFALHSRPAEAFDTFHQLLEVHKIRPDKVSFLNVLGAASASGPEFLEKGRGVHALITRGSSLEFTDVAVGTALVDMYSKCGSLDEARQVFDRIQKRDVVAWNAMLTGYARHERWSEALHLFTLMKKEVLPNRISVSAALHACANTGELEAGREVHRWIVEPGGIPLDSLVGNALIALYSKCGELETAARIFSSSCYSLHVSSWNTMLTAYIESQRSSEAMELVHRMHHEGVGMDDVSLATILNAVAICSPEKWCLSEGKAVHGFVLEAGLGEDLIIATTLLNMYAKCGDLEQSRRVFHALPGQRRDLVAWNAMASAYVQHELPKQAHQLFSEMLLEGARPNEISFINAISACEFHQPITKLEQLHNLAIESGFSSERVVATVLVTAYGVCGEIHRAELVFSSTPHRDVVLWNAMITAATGAESPRLALKIYEEMDLKPDKLTLILALNAAAALADASSGRIIHDRLGHLGFDSDIGSVTALVNMYSKCGEVDEAERIFKLVERPSLFMWNALISGYIHRGDTHRGVVLFGQMQQSGERADGVSLVSVLSGFGQKGDVNQGCCCFGSLVHEFGVAPVREHYACVLDLLGRAGRLEEAEEWIGRMPESVREQNRTLWGTMLAACAIHSDSVRGRRAAEELFHLRSTKSSPYVIMSNLSLCNGVGIT